MLINHVNLNAVVIVRVSIIEGIIIILNKIFKI